MMNEYARYTPSHWTILLFIDLKRRARTSVRLATRKKLRGPQSASTDPTMGLWVFSMNVSPAQHRMQPGAAKLFTTSQLFIVEKL